MRIKVVLFWFCLIPFQSYTELTPLEFWVSVQTETLGHSTINSLLNADYITEWIYVDKSKYGTISSPLYLDKY